MTDLEFFRVSFARVSDAYGVDTSAGEWWAGKMAGICDLSEKQPNSPRGTRLSFFRINWVFRGAGGRD